MRQRRMDARSVGSPADGQQYEEVLEGRMAQSSNSGHRQRLKARFMAGDPTSRSDAALLELLLSYAIPQRDVRPLAERLLERFVSLDGVLAADPAALCTVDGLAEHSAVLIKLCALLYRRGVSESAAAQQMPLLDPEPVVAEAATAPPSAQIGLFDEPAPDPAADLDLPVSNETAPQSQDRNGAETSSRRQVVPPRGSDLVTKSVLREAIEMLPRLPDTESLDEISAFLKTNLHFSALQTRERYAAYINRRMFPAGYADQAMRSFATAFADQQELRDVAFYRFCCVEPLVGRVVRELLVPAISAGFVERRAIRDYLSERYPESRSIADASQAVVETLVSGGLARADRNRLSFGYREVLLPSFAFILHSEFTEPSMYPLRDLERNPVLQTMLWKPDRVMPALYELRNQGLIARISEIDSVRQFTLRYTLDSLVRELVATEVRQ